MSEADLAKIFLNRQIPYVKPLYSINLSKDSEVIDWFKTSNNTLDNFYRPLFLEQRENFRYYIGSTVNPGYSSPFGASWANVMADYSESAQIFVNEMFRVVTEQVSLIVSHELVPDVLPNNDNYSDKVACNIVRQWLESMNYDLNTEGWRARWELQKKLFGESFAIVMWDKNAGDLHPDVRDLMDEDIDLLDENDEPITNLSGDSVKIRKNLRIGDIRFRNPMPWDVHFDPQQDFNDSEWFYWRERVDVEKLKKKFPKLSWDRTAQGAGYFDPFSGDLKEDPNRRTIYYLFHRSNEFLPEGRFIVCSEEHVLVNRSMELPTILNNQTLPIVRFHDLDIGVGTRSFSQVFRNCRNLSEGYNKVTNQMFNNIEMDSPKVFVHETSGVDAQRMPNGALAIMWRGNQKPTIETPNSNSASLSKMREDIKRNIDEMALQNSLIRGETPNAQLDSFVALQYFEDLRNQLAAQDIKGHIRAMENLFRLMITVAKDKYQPEDGRLIKILGRHNTYQLKYFDPINLQKSYDVKITTTGNLANSKAGRTQMMISIKREFPNTISDELFLDMLGLSHTQKFQNAITAAVSAAEAENQDMMNGMEVEPPSRFEDLLTHWEVHRIPMQTSDFKHSPDEIKELFVNHVTMTEKLMYEQAAESPSFAARLEALRQFPMFYTPAPVNEPPPAPVPEMGMLPPPEMPPEMEPEMAPDLSM